MSASKQAVSSKLEIANMLDALASLLPATSGAIVLTKPKIGPSTLPEDVFIHIPLVMLVLPETTFEHCVYLHVDKQCHAQLLDFKRAALQLIEGNVSPVASTCILAPPKNCRDGIEALVGCLNVTAGPANIEILHYQGQSLVEPEQLHDQNTHFSLIAYLSTPATEIHRQPLKKPILPDQKCIFVLHLTTKQNNFSFALLLHAPFGTTNYFPALTLEPLVGHHPT